MKFLTFVFAMLFSFSIAFAGEADSKDNDAKVKVLEKKIVGMVLADAESYLKEEGYKFKVDKGEFNDGIKPAQVYAFLVIEIPQGKDSREISFEVAAAHVTKMMSDITTVHIELTPFEKKEQAFWRQVDKDIVGVKWETAKKTLEDKKYNFSLKKVPDGVEFIEIWTSIVNDKGVANLVRDYYRIDNGVVRTIEATAFDGEEKEEKSDKKEPLKEDSDKK